MRKFAKKAVLYIKYFWFCIFRQILKVFHVFPINKNRVVFVSFNGRQYSCNPRAVSEALYEKFGEKLEIVWAFNNPDEFKKIVPEYVKCIRMSSCQYYYFSKTAKVIVCNARSNGVVSKRKNQYIIQTWHASNGYKKLHSESGIYRELSNLACRDFSFVNSGCENMVRERVNGTLNFHGPIIKGTPRMDVIINGDCQFYKNKVFEELQIPNDCNAVLYAPTYRSSLQTEFGLDYSEVVSLFEEKFGGKWVLLVRMHYFVNNAIKENENIIDVTKYPDIQDLMLASDAMISDYSSCVWDFSFLKKPCFLYCYDLSFYENAVNFNIPIREWGFPLATDMKELAEKIRNYNQDEFLNAMENHHKRVGNFEDGHAAERTCDIIGKLTEVLE